ncbi:hypothetical protein D3C87_1896830 [compost metagenome]
MGDIVPPDIEQPADFIQHREQIEVRMAGLHGFADFRQLLGPGFACIFGIMNIERVTGYGRPVLPDCPCGIQIRPDRNRFVRQERSQFIQ